MGCDIHLYMERRLQGRWVPVNASPHEGDIDYQREYPWGAYTDAPPPVEELAQAALPLEERVPTRAFEWAFGRNYDAFGRLSGVRTNNQYREPNGIPADVSTAVKARWEDWGGDSGDGHTPTHWTLEDLAEAHSDGRDAGGSYGTPRIDALLLEMWRVANEYNLEPADVRIVLWYDN